MATSAAKLSEIINALSEEFSFDSDNAFSILSEKSLLPKKLITCSPAPAKKVSPWASKKAEEVADEHGITSTFLEKKFKTGSGKNGKWILSDVEKAMSNKVKTKVNASPHALKFASDNEIDLTGKTGTGSNGRILLADVEKLLENDSDSDSESDKDNNIQID